MKIKATIIPVTLGVLAFSSSAFGWSSPEVAMVLDEGPTASFFNSLTLDRYDVPTGQSLGSISLGQVFNGTLLSGIAVESSTVIDVFEGNAGVLKRYDWTNGNLISTTTYHSGFNGNIVNSNGNSYTWIDYSTSSGLASQIVQLNVDGTITNIGSILNYQIANMGSDGKGIFAVNPNSTTLLNQLYSVSGSALATIGGVFNWNALGYTTNGIGITANGQVALAFSNSFDGVLGNPHTADGTSSVSQHYLATGHGDEALSIGLNGTNDYNLTDFSVGNVIDPVMRLELGSAFNNPVGLAVYAAPEPKSFLLMGMGLIGLVALKRRRA